MRGVRASDYSQNTLGVNFNKKEGRRVINYSSPPFIINKCKYENQVILLNELREKGKILVSTLNSSINTLIKKELVKIVLEEEYREALITDLRQKATNYITEHQYFKCNYKVKS